MLNHTTHRARKIENEAFRKRKNLFFHVCARHNHCDDPNPLLNPIPVSTCGVANARKNPIKRKWILVLPFFRWLREPVFVEDGESLLPFEEQPLSHLVDAGDALVDADAGAPEVPLVPHQLQPLLRVELLMVLLGRAGERRHNAVFHITSAFVH